jgi:hypothetical protein
MAQVNIEQAGRNAEADFLPSSSLLGFSVSRVLNAHRLMNRGMA